MQRTQEVKEMRAHNDPLPNTASFSTQLTFKFASSASAISAQSWLSASLLSVTRTKHIFFSAFYLRANNRPAVSESSGISMSQTEEKVKEIYHIISHCIASQSKPVSLSEPPHRRKYNLKFDVSLSLAAYTKVRLPCIITCTFRRLRLPLPSVLRSPTSTL